ncbi:MAG: ATP-binding cassette domain-containing protein [Butyrivibrio sp.]|nr:ATP-binding cassette domain-containing protein [Butyrivibrio sp.]
MLSLENVKKSYKKHTALNNINCVFKPGIYGILGPNGAGKSTLMGIITTGITDYEGKVFYNEKDIKKLGNSYRKNIAYVPQQQKLYEELTGIQFLAYFAALKGLSNKEAKISINNALDVVNLTDCANKRISSYSGGMKQRLLIAQALLTDFDILLLDEPTVGLDPEERNNLKEYLRKIAGSKTILLASHIVSDVESLATDIVLLKRGNIVYFDGINNAINEYGSIEALYKKLNKND